MAENNYLDQNGVLYLWQKIKTKISDAVKNKVDKVDGKGLSTNDYTTAEKTKLAGIATNANNYSHPTSSGNKHIPSGGSAGQILRWTADGTAAWGSDNNTIYSDFKGPTANAAGVHGLVPAPAKGQPNAFLLGSGRWANSSFNIDVTGMNQRLQGVLTEADGTQFNFLDLTIIEATQGNAGLMTANDKTKLDGIAANANNYSHPTTSGNKHIPSGGSAGQILRWTADGTAVWGPDNNTTYSDMKGATDSATGTHGLVPAPAAGKQGQYLRGDGTWATPTNTTYADATQSTHGLMSASDKKKMDDLPTASALQSTYAKKSDITGVYKYKGSVATEDKLPTSGQTTGDVYDIAAASSYGAAGMNVAWNGTAWDALGEKFQISAITNTWMDTNLT